jgi:hypothetical protein
MPALLTGQIKMQLRQAALMGVNFSPSGLGYRRFASAILALGEAHCGGCNAPVAAQMIFIEHN